MESTILIINKDLQKIVRIVKYPKKQQAPIPAEACWLAARPRSRCCNAASCVTLQTITVNSLDPLVAWLLGSDFVVNFLCVLSI